MTQAPTGAASTDVGPVRNDIYTALIIIATGFVFVAAIFAMIRCVQLFESLLPPAGG